MKNFLKNIFVFSIDFLPKCDIICVYGLTVFFMLEQSEKIHFLVLGKFTKLCYNISIGYPIMRAT